MASRELKTRLTNASVTEFLEAVEGDARRADGHTLLALMGRATGQEPRMWGASIVGFGSYSYCDSSGRQHSWMATGFSPRKTAMSIYIMPGFSRYRSLLERLGPHKTGKSCLYVKRLSDIDQTVLEDLVTRSYRDITEKYGDGAKN